MYPNVISFDKLNLSQFDWFEIEELEMQLIDFQSSSIWIQKFIETRKKLELIEAERLTRNIPGRASHLQKGAGKEGSGQYDKARETRTTTSGTNREAERRRVRSKQATAVRPCPYYLRSRVKQPEGIPEEQRSNGIDSIPQNNIK
ncbi:dimer_Tnp_hAT domain-containing protein [Trichonephila clavipes]|uniref:Dimer_Tnp_hAT domain-containing protein n=1 Tax=Trichonephila clavipes TaxID=2585209 RepID=A0A8X7BEU6_TRICX|nr:dimer_Tnp_hAT domain-containing protein [Trichonephila clavipes]